MPIPSVASTPIDASAPARAPAPVLIVEPPGPGRDRLVAELTGAGLEVRVCNDLATASASARSCPPGLIVAHWDPSDDGISSHWLDDQAGPEWHPIILHGDGTPDQCARAIERGAFDVVATTTAPALLQARVRSGLRFRERLDRLERRAYRDGLTGLINRGALEDQLRRQHEASRRHGTSLSVLIVDLDRFKAINDAHGHPSGDEALQRVAAVLTRSVRNSDLVARYGGDEFIVVAPACPPASAVLLAARFRDCLAAPSGPTATADTGDLLTIPISLSIGIAGTDGPDPVDLDELLRRADQALYLAKRSGRDAVALYDPSRGGPTLVPAP